jgi:uroporphyrinogen decarboxylase
MTQNEHLLIRAAFNQPVERVPVWAMRQAGRYLKEYRDVREQAGRFLDLCFNPELAAEVSIQPLDLIGVDAVIMFSDILTPLMGIGMDLDFTPGPVFSNPIRHESDIETLTPFDPESAVPYVGKILQILRREVGDRAPIIGFSGAPFTLAAYMVEGSGGEFRKIKSLLWEKPNQAHKLLSRLTDLVIDYLNYQIENGADMVQVFDTWAGLLTTEAYQQFAAPYLQRIFSSLSNKGIVPQVYYMKGGQRFLSQLKLLGADVISCDWLTNLKEAREILGNQMALQGNLDPDLLFCSQETIRIHVKQTLDQIPDHTGHIFNLGHGVNKAVSPDALRCMVKAVKEFSKGK